MKNKEAIFYEANSFPSPGPEILELKSDNKGSVIEEGMQGPEVQLTERKIKNFKESYHYSSRKYRLIYY